MRFMRAQTQQGPTGRSRDGSPLPTVALAGSELGDETLGRCEAQAIVSRAVATDPYAAWLERREAERRLRERPEIRWVYRYPRGAGKAGNPGRGGTREALAQSRPGSSEEGLVSVR